MITEEFETLFTEIYKGNAWKCSETPCGGGATIKNSHGIRVNLKEIIENYNIKSILDLSCGDWNWMKECKDWLGKYTGVDIVKEMIDYNTNHYSTNDIKFVHSDMLKHLRGMKDKSVDLVIIRQTLEHLPEEYNLSVIEELKRVSKYFIITGQDKNHGNQNVNTTSGTASPESRGIKLHASPYSKLLGSPISTFVDGPEGEEPNMKYLGHLFHNEEPKPVEDIPSSKKYRKSKKNS